MSIKIILAIIISMNVFILTAGNPIEITIWEGFKFEEHTLFVELMREFEKEYKENHNVSLKIRIERVPFDDMITKIKMACLARETPDLAIVDALRVPEMAFGKVLVPLDSLSNFEFYDIEEARQKFVPAAFDSNIVNVLGKENLYGLPAQTTTLALFWNRDIFHRYRHELREAGLDPNRAPRDWEEFIAYGKILTNPDDGIFGFAMTNSLWFSFPFINTFQGSLLRYEEDQPVPNFHDERVRAALQMKVDLYRKHRIEAGAWQAGAIAPEQGFINENYAMIFMGPWNIERFQAVGLNFGVDLIPRPSKNQALELGLIGPDASQQEYEQKVTTSSNIGGNNVVIFRGSEHPEIAYDVARFFAGEYAQRKWAEKLGQIPVILEAQEDIDLKDFPEILTFIEQINYAKAIPPIPLYGTLESDVYTPEMDLTLQGRAELDRAIQNMNRHFQRLILDRIIIE